MVTNANRPFLRTYSHGNWIQGEVRPLQDSTEQNALTLTRIFDFFVAWYALALYNWYNPLPVHGAVDARQLLADGVIHAHPAHFTQRLVRTSGHGLRERRKALHRGCARFVVDPGGEESDAGSDVLKSQVEAFPRQVLHHFRLGVDAQFVHAGDLVRCYGGHLPKLALAEGSAHICVRLGCEEVEGFLAGQRGGIERVAIANDELEFDENPRSRWTSLDEGGAQPVVLISFPNIADGVGVELRAVQGPLGDFPLKQNHTRLEVRTLNPGEPPSMQG